MASLACGKFCGDTSPRGFRVSLREEQCKENRRGERYEGHDEREAGREKQEAAGAGAPGRSCECASRGGRIVQDRTRKALRADWFSARLKSCPVTKSGWLGFRAFHICQKRTDVEHPRAVWISKRGKLLRFKRLALVTGDCI